jgi:hypothetical protein
MTEERPPEQTPASDDTQATPTPDAPPPAAAPPAYTPLTYTPPPIAPPAAQPTVAWAPPPTTTAAVGQRTTLSLAAGILLVVLGAFGVVISLLLLTIGRSVIQAFDFRGMPGTENINDPNALVGGVVAFLGIFLLVCSTFYVVGGVGVIRSRNWGRVIGIVIGILAGLLWLGSLTGANNVGGRNDLAFPLILLAIHAYVAIVLLFFWRTKTAG